MWNDFISLFANMGVIPIVLLVIGVLFLCVEMCVPGFGAFGYIGIGCFIVGAIVRAVNGANVTQICMLILMCLIVVILFFVLISRSLRKGVLSKTAIVESGQAVESNYKSKNLVLIGKKCVTLCDCKPAGSMKIDDKVYNCVSESKYIKKNKECIVTQIKNDDIIIKQVEEN